MKRIFVIVMAMVLCVSSLFAFPVFAVEDSIHIREDDLVVGDAAGTYAVSSAFRVKLFSDLNKESKLVLAESMAGVKFYEEAGTDGIFISGTVKELTSGKILIDEDFDFDEKPEGRGTDVQPVGRISLDGLSDKKSRITVSVYLDDETTPRASMLLRRQLGKTGWTREGDMTVNVLGQKITGKHKVYIGFSAEGMDEDKKTKILLRSFSFCEDSIPVMYFDIDESEGSIDAMNSSEGHIAECYGNVTLQVPAGYKGEFSEKELKTLENLELDYIRGRGNSTWGMDKKPYKFKLDKKQDLLGMGKNRHWILLANRYDNSLQRNRITYWITRHMGMEFAIKCAPVEVVMNGRYFGSYLLAEQIRVGENRIEIDELDEKVKDPESIEMTGGYLLNLGGSDEEAESTFRTEHGGAFEIESPDFSEYPMTEDAKQAKTAQRKYIADYVEKTENVLFSPGMKDSEGHSYDEYLDEQSAVDYWWIQEFSMNGDAYVSGSSYLYKKRDSGDERGKLYWGPLWDFDYVAWGNPNCDAEAYTSFDYTSHDWMTRLRTDETFCGRLRARWSEAQDSGNMFSVHIDDLITEVVKDGGILDQYYDESRVSEYYDNVRWGFYNEDGWGYSSVREASQDQDEQNPYGQDPYGQDPYEHDQDVQDPDAPQTYESEIEQLRSWILKRQSWVNENIADIGVSSYTVRFLIGGKVLETRSYYEGEELGKLPEAPKKSGYVFTGWYDKYGNRASEDATAYFDMDFSGKYVKKSKLKKPEHIYFRTYDAYSWFSEYDEENVYSPSYALMPEDSVAGEIAWSVSDPEIAEVDRDGNVTPKKPGKVKVTATLSSGRKNSYNVTFLPNEDEMLDVEKLTLSKKRLSLAAGKYTQIRADQSPKPHYSSDIDWFTTASDIISVDDFGIVRAKKPGHAVVIAIDAESHTFAVCKVTVPASAAYAKKAKVTGVKAKVVRAGKATAGTAGKAKSAAAGKKSSVRVTWNKVSGVSGYYVLRSTKKSGKYKKAGSVKRSRKTRWTDKKVVKGKTYYYKVQPYTKIGGKTYKGKLSGAAKVKVR